MTLRNIGLLATLLASPLLALAQDNVFERDPRLHQSLWGIAYTPPNAANYPTCGDTIEGVVRDVQLMSQLTTRMRLYGTDCGQADLVLEAINRTQVDMAVFIGVYMDANTTTYERQRDQAFAAIQKWGTRHVAGISVGNEYILQSYTEDPATRPTAEALVISNMADTRSKLAALNLDRTIPVGTADAGSQVTLALAEGADFVMANTHAFFSGVTIADAADWTAQYLVNDEPRYVAQASNRPTLYAAEVGWPTDALAGGSLSLNGSAATLENAQTFLDTWVCAANANNSVGYFYFEFADAEWKRSFLGSEPFWGLFDSNRQLKNLNIPTCLAPAAGTIEGNPGGQNGGTSGPGVTPSPSSGSGSSGGGSSGALPGAKALGVGALVSFAALVLGVVVVV